jgi:hypothetical protein
MLGLYGVLLALRRPGPQSRLLRILHHQDHRAVGIAVADMPDARRENTAALDVYLVSTRYSARREIGTQTSVTTTLVPAR